MLGLWGASVRCNFLTQETKKIRLRIVAELKLDKEYLRVEKAEIDTAARELLLKLFIDEVRLRDNSRARCKASTHGQGRLDIRCAAGGSAVDDLGCVCRA